METQELAAAVTSAHHAAQNLAANPNCRDPNHPGCTQCDGAQEERKEEMRTDFIHDALRDVKLPAKFAPMVDDYSKGASNKFSRYQTVGEVMFESLDYTNGPDYDDLLQLLADAARGADIRPQALNLVKRMAATYARMNVVVVA